MKMSEIVGNLEVHDAKAASLAAQYSLIDSNGKIISELKKESTGEFNLPIPELAEGNYTLLIQVGEYKTEKLIRKLAKLPGEVRFDENKVMYVDGKKTIPYGWFSFPFGEKDLQDLSEIGYTLHVWYASPGNNDDQIRECLNRFAKAGIKCALYPYPNYTMNTGEAVRRPLNQEEAAAIRQRVRNLKNHPALLGWYLHDEPELRAGLPARFMEIHDICQDEDPYHPTIILNTTVAGIHKFAEVADISMPDIYPAFIDGGDAGVDLSVIFNSNMTGNEASERINWFTPQGFDWSDFGRPGQRAPNFVELRNMQYQAVLSGATGFCWFSWAYLESMPEVYLGVNHLVKEARVLSELWFNPQKKVLLPSDSPQVIAANYPDINGVDYIIAVNNTTVSKKIELPASKNLYYALGEKLSFKINNKKLSDNLEKYQVRVYCSDKEIADSFDLNGYKPLLKKALKDLHREGNLAYAYKTGVKIELQQENPGGYPAWHLSDGVYRRSFILSEKDREDAIVSITFPKKVTASKIKLFGKGLKSAELEIKRNGNWVKVANLEKVDDEYLEAEWKKEKFDKLRLIRINAGRISEIEVY